MVRAGVDVLWIARYDYRKGWRLRPHHHSYFQMIHFLSGKGSLRIDGREHEISGGEIVLLKPGLVHALRADSLLSTFDVKFRVTAKVLDRLLMRADSPIEWREPGLAGRFERIRQEGEQKRPYYREMCSSLLQEMLYLYLRQQQLRQQQAVRTPTPEPVVETPPHDNLLVKAEAFLRANVGQQMTVRQI